MRTAFTCSQQTGCQRLQALGEFLVTRTVSGLLILHEQRHQQPVSTASYRFMIGRVRTLHVVLCVMVICHACSNGAGTIDGRPFWELVGVFGMGFGIGKVRVGKGEYKVYERMTDGQKLTRGKWAQLFSNVPRRVLSPNLKFFPKIISNDFLRMYKSNLEGFTLFPVSESDIPAFSSTFKRPSNQG